MENLVIIAIIAAIVASAVIYVIKAKKSGRKCIGCPYSGCPNCKAEKSGCTCERKDF